MVLQLLDTGVQGGNRVEHFVVLVVEFLTFNLCLLYLLSHQDDVLLQLYVRLLLLVKVALDLRPCCACHHRQLDGLCFVLFKVLDALFKLVHFVDGDLGGRFGLLLGFKGATPERRLGLEDHGKQLRVLLDLIKAFVHVFVLVDGLLQFWLHLLTQLFLFLFDHLVFLAQVFHLLSQLLYCLFLSGEVSPELISFLSDSVELNLDVL